MSDEDWIRPALSALSFLLPGKAKGFRGRDLAEAKAWLAAFGLKQGGMAWRISRRRRWGSSAMSPGAAGAGVVGGVRLAALLTGAAH